MERCTGTNRGFLYVYRVCPYDSSQVKYRRGGILHCSTNNSVGRYGVRSLVTILFLLLDGSKAVACLVLSLGIIEGISVLNWIAVGDYFARARFGTISGITTILYGNGALIAPVISGWLFAQTNSYSWVLLIIGGLLELSSIALRFSSKPTPEAVRSKSK